MAVIALLGCYVVVYALFWLPASVVVRGRLSDRVRREWELELLSLVLALVAGYATFWLYLLQRRLGLVASCLLLAAGGAVIVFRRCIDPGPLRRHFSAPVRLAFLLGLLYLGAVTLFGGLQRVPTSYVPNSTLDVPSCYFWLLPRAGDELIPLKFAQALATGGPLRGAMLDFPGDWLLSDRPPLQSGTLLLFWLLARLVPTGLLNQAVGTMLQVQWVIALAGLATALCWGRRRLGFVLLLVALSGVVYYNALFVWPKLLAAALAIAAAAPLASAWRGRRALSDVEILLASSAAALAMLAHGTAAFTLLPVALLALAYRPFLRLRVVLPAAVVAAVLYLPWSAYQKYVDPPGDRCAKWMLTGKLDPDGPPLAESLRQAYSELTLRQWLAYRAEGLLRMVSWPELDSNIARCVRGMLDPHDRPAEPFARLYYCRSEDLSYDAPTVAALLRYDQVEQIFRALGLLNLAWPVLVLRLVRGRSLRRAGLGLLLLLTVSSLFLWWLLIFDPKLILIRAASMAMILGLMAIAALVIYDLPPLARWTVAGLQLAFTALLWVWFVPTNFARSFLGLAARPGWVPLAVALLSLAGVLYYCLAARVRYRRFVTSVANEAQPPRGGLRTPELAVGIAAVIVFLLVAGGAVHRKSPLAQIHRRGCITPSGVPVNIICWDILGLSTLFDRVTNAEANFATWTLHAPLVLRFPSRQRLKEVRLHWYDSDGRNYRFQLETEQDGRWTMILDRSKQGAVGLVSVPLDPKPLNAIRITGFYNSAQEVQPDNKFMHLKELELIPAVLTGGGDAP